MAVTIRYETHSLTVDNETGHAAGWLPGQLSAQGQAFCMALYPAPWRWLTTHQLRRSSSNSQCAPLRRGTAAV